MKYFFKAGLIAVLITVIAGRVFGQATPVHVNVRDCTGSALDRVVTFTPLDGVKGFYGTNLVPPSEVIVKTSAGVANTNLVTGNYRVTFSSISAGMTIFWPGNPSITNLADPRVQRDGVTSVFELQVPGNIAAGSNVTVTVVNGTNVISAAGGGTNFYAGTANTNIITVLHAPFSGYDAPLRLAGYTNMVATYGNVPYWTNSQGQGAILDVFGAFDGTYEFGDIPTLATVGDFDFASSTGSNVDGPYTDENGTSFGNGLLAFFGQPALVVSGVVVNTNGAYSGRFNGTFNGVLGDVTATDPTRIFPLETLARKTNSQVFGPWTNVIQVHPTGFAGDLNWDRVYLYKEPGLGGANVLQFSDPWNTNGGAITFGGWNASGAQMFFFANPNHGGGPEMQMVSCAFALANAYNQGWTGEHFSRAPNRRIQIGIGGGDGGHAPMVFIEDSFGDHPTIGQTNAYSEALLFSVTPTNIANGKNVGIQGWTLDSVGGDGSTALRFWTSFGANNTAYGDTSDAWVFPTSTVGMDLVHNDGLRVYGKVSAKTMMTTNATGSIDPRWLDYDVGNDDSVLLSHSGGDFFFGIQNSDESYKRWIEFGTGGEMGYASIQPETSLSTYGVGAHRFYVNNRMYFQIWTNGCVVSNNLAVSNGFFQLPLFPKSSRPTAPVGAAIFQSDNTPGIRVWNGTHWVKFTETNDD